MAFPSLVIGLGYGGKSAARTLEGLKKEVIAVDRKDFFLNYVHAMEELLCKDVDNNEPAYKFKGIEGPDQSRNISFLHAEAKVDGDSVTMDLQDGSKLVLKIKSAGSFTGDKSTLPKRIQYAIERGVEEIIVSTGAPVPLPFSPKREIVTMKQFVPAWTELHKKVRQAKNVMVVGGGAVACEFSGFMSDLLPKHVYLCMRSEYPYHDLTKKLQESAKSQLIEKLGADHFITKATPEGSFKRYENFPNFCFFDKPTDVKLSNGTSIKDIDFIFFGYSDASATPAHHVIDEKAAIVNRKMQSVANPNIKVVGDLANFQDPTLGDTNMGFIATMQGQIVAQGKTYKSLPGRGLISPIGKTHGVSLLPLPFVGEYCASAYTTHKILAKKSKKGDKSNQETFGAAMLKSA